MQSFFISIGVSKQFGSSNDQKMTATDVCMHCKCMSEAMKSQQEYWFVQNVGFWLELRRRKKKHEIT